MGARGVGANAGLPAHHGREVSTRWLVFPLPHLGLCSTLDTTWRSSTWALSRSSGHIDVRNVSLGSRGRRSRYLRCSRRLHERHQLPLADTGCMNGTTIRSGIQPCGARSASRLQQRPLRPSLGRPVSSPEWLKAHTTGKIATIHTHTKKLHMITTNNDLDK